MGKEEDNYDMDMLTNFRVSRFQESIDENPYCKPPFPIIRTHALSGA